MRKARRTETPEQEPANEPTPEPEATAEEPVPSPAMQRAEQLVDQFGTKVGQYASWLGEAVMRLTARAREEAEDMWAEAQHLREQATTRQESSTSEGSSQASS